LATFCHFDNNDIRAHCISGPVPALWGFPGSSDRFARCAISFLYIRWKENVVSSAECDKDSQTVPFICRDMWCSKYPFRRQCNHTVAEEGRANRIGQRLFVLARCLFGFGGTLFEEI